MAQFTFTLQPLLRQRERAEQERQRDVAVANAELIAAQSDLRQIERAVQTALTDLRTNHLVGAIDLSFLTAHRRFMTAMQRQAADRSQRAAVAAAKVDAAQRQLAEAAKQRRAIETLRDQQHERWRVEQARRETAATDEIAMQMVAEDDRRDREADEDGR